jgi:hypothetical protein
VTKCPKPAPHFYSDRVVLKEFAGLIRGERDPRMDKAAVSGMIERWW